MDMTLKQAFIERWERDFPGADLPITYYYADSPGGAEVVNAAEHHRCIIAALARVRNGHDLCFGVDAVGCPGGKRYFGFTQDVMPHFDEFLSCGIPGQLEGERYKKSPEIVHEMMAQFPAFAAPAPYLIFKRWDRLEPQDEPIVAVFFAPPDVLSGLFTLAGFDEADRDSTVAPFGAGCATIGMYPCLEAARARPRAVLGMFDVSARPFVPGGCLSFAVPMNKFAAMVRDMDASFLGTPSWARVRKRMS